MKKHFKWASHFTKAIGLATGIILILNQGKVNAASFIIDDESAWVERIKAVHPNVEIFTVSFSPDNLKQAINETGGHPKVQQNLELGASLTFNQDVTGYPLSFTFASRHRRAQLVFADREGNNKCQFFCTDDISIGDVDNFENDDWIVSTTSRIVGFAFELLDNDNEGFESISIYDEPLVSQGSPIYEGRINAPLIGLLQTPKVPTGKSRFIGIESNDHPFQTIVFDEDDKPDDIAVRSFRFAVVRDTVSQGQNSGRTNMRSPQPKPRSNR
jgi:hypothetical protein